MLDTTTFLYGAARIGTGTTLHRAVKYSATSTVQIVCGCPNTSNNHARISGFFPNLLGTCKRSIARTTARCPRCDSPKPVGRSCDCFDNGCQ
jgi:hypothetical protein